MAKAKVLVVDDEEDIVELLVDWLEWHGLEARAAKDGLECLERVAEDVPDVVLLDLIMPRMDGLSTLGKLRQDYPQVPVIVLTASSGRKVADEALLAGAVAYLLKPWSSEELKASIAAALGAEPP